MIYFFERMSGVEERRRQQNRRLLAAPDTPAAAERLGPSEGRSKGKELPQWQQQLVGRSGWHCAILKPQTVRTFFLFTWQYRTYLLDISSCRSGAAYILGANDVGCLEEKVLPLECFGLENVEAVREVFLGAVAGEGAISLTVRRARDIRERLPAKRRRAKRKRDGSGSDAEPETEDAESDEALMETIEGDAGGSDANSSDASVDTDADSGVDDLFLVEHPTGGETDAVVSDLEEPAEHESASGWAGGADEEDGPVASRHAPGTWVVWSNLWFYMTQTPGYDDIKVIVKGPLRNSATGLGLQGLSKTITPRHYGDELADPWRSKLVLRAWAVWRARQGGWAEHLECRRRELLRDTARLLGDLRRAAGPRPKQPLLGSPEAHRRLAEWVPELVTELLAAHSPAAAAERPAPGAA